MYSHHSRSHQLSWLQIVANTKKRRNVWGGQGIIKNHAGIDMFLIGYIPYPKKDTCNTRVIQKQRQKKEKGHEKKKSPHHEKIRKKVGRPHTYMLLKV